MKKKVFAIMLVLALTVSCFAGCGKKSSSSGSGSDEIHVVSREDGSGTRSAFIELLGIQKDDVDRTVSTAEETNSTAVMLTTVQGNESAIGYVSLGSYDSSKVKAVNVDGVAATTENVKNGTYKVSRPFNIATKSDISEAAKDFYNFILSTEGQAVVEEEGYIPMENSKPYESNGSSGKIVVGGSSSVGPVMEKIQEAYEKVNTNITVELQITDSSTGMSSAADGTYDIGMASRELKDSEIEKGLMGTQIALDGIAVIVNKDNKVDNLTSEQIMNIYIGELTSWGDVK